MLLLWQWIRNQIVQQIPEEIALCEFDCYKQQCTDKEWQTCTRRIAVRNMMAASASSHRCAGRHFKGRSVSFGGDHKDCRRVTTAMTKRHSHARIPRQEKLTA
jgi:hypothetical protein